LKIGWLADNFYPEVQRGAELEDHILITEGINRGHEIIKSKRPIKNVDLYIVANFIDMFNVGELLAYLTLHPYVNIEHDLRAPQFPFYSVFAKGALINVYHSPYQKAFIENYAGNFNHFMHPMCLPEQFKDYRWNRLPENEVLYVGDYSWEKGYREMVEYVEGTNNKIWHVGAGFDKKHPLMVEVGSIPQKRMPDVYNTFSSLIFLPHYPQACSRVIAEAFLCKVPNIMTNGLDGFTSYGWIQKEDYDVVRERLVNGHKIFWDKIEELLW